MWFREKGGFVHTDGVSMDAMIYVLEYMNIGMGRKRRAKFF